ncbi:MAG TPA: hypothetical protein VHA56_01725 [Mucilaginibacter sp.]|nr:hypothetical protein [Mucilaginibacter sp.]
MKTWQYILPLIIFSILAGCKNSIDQAKLYGKWKYIKVGHPTAHPPDSVSDSELKYASPSVEFFRNDQYVIMWSGKVLSHGKFSTEGMSINITETMPDSSTREFPFWVTKLTDKTIVFETKGDEKSRVTAIRE